MKFKIKKKTKKRWVRRGKGFVLLSILICAVFTACTQQKLYNMEYDKLATLRNWADVCEQEMKIKPNGKCSIFYESPPVYPNLKRN